MQKLSNGNAGSEEGAVARPAGVGGKDSRRRASLHGRIHPAPKFHNLLVMEFRCRVHGILSGE
ncbi:hypothetical protein [Methylotuvimicrobium sp. KM2]|uniref:hypothetical protein n=1 Tax=Methylotuvimicrobium sp. KM2 TaxID=3133976 RepID=UPI0031018B13